MNFIWQDIYFALSGAFFGAVLIPSCMDRKTEVPRTSSVPTASLLVVNAAVWASMGMWWAAGLSSVVAGVWGFLALRRPIRPEPTHVFVLQQGEEAIVMQYRQYVAHQKMLRGGGCGGCPSQGGCADEEA